MTALRTGTRLTGGGHSDGLTGAPRLCPPWRCVYPEWLTSDRNVFTRQEGWRASPSHEIVFVFINIKADVLVRLLLFVYLQQLIAPLRLFPSTFLRQGALLLLPFPCRLAVEQGTQGPIIQGTYQDGERVTRKAPHQPTSRQPYITTASVVRTRRTENKGRPRPAVNQAARRHAGHGGVIRTSSPGVSAVYDCPGGPGLWPQADQPMTPRCTMADARIPPGSPPPYQPSTPSTATPPQKKTHLPGSAGQLPQVSILLRCQVRERLRLGLV